jgi:hypothetical protein
LTEYLEFLRFLWQTVEKASEFGHRGSTVETLKIITRKNLKKNRKICGVLIISMESWILGEQGLGK